MKYTQRSCSIKISEDFPQKYSRNISSIPTTPPPLQKNTSTSGIKPSSRSYSQISDAERDNEKDKGNAMFRRFYNKFSNNLDSLLSSGTAKNIKLIGNHRFTDEPVQHFANEKHVGHIYNKFNPQYQRDMKELEKMIDTVKRVESEQSEDSSDWISAKRVFREKRAEVLSKLELTPLPLAKKVTNLKVEEKESVTKAERAAVLMRRYEYEHTRNRCQKLIPPRKTPPKDRKVEMKNARADYELEWYLNCKIVKIQRKWREYRAAKFIKKVILIQKWYRFHYQRRLQNFHECLDMESQGFEILRNNNINYIYKVSLESVGSTNSIQFKQSFTQESVKNRSSVPLHYSSKSFSFSPNVLSYQFLAEEKPKYEMADDPWAIILITRIQRAYWKFLKSRGMKMRVKIFFPELFSKKSSSLNLIILIQRMLKRFLAMKKEMRKRFFTRSVVLPSVMTKIFLDSKEYMRRKKEFLLQQEKEALRNRLKVGKLMDFSFIRIPILKKPNTRPLVLPSYERRIFLNSSEYEKIKLALLPPKIPLEVGNELNFSLNRKEEKRIPNKGRIYSASYFTKSIKKEYHSSLILLQRIMKNFLSFKKNLLKLMKSKAKLSHSFYTKEFKDVKSVIVQPLDLSKVRGSSETGTQSSLINTKANQKVGHDREMIDNHSVSPVKPQKKVKPKEKAALSGSVYKKEVKALDQIVKIILIQRKMISILTKKRQLRIQQNTRIQEKARVVDNECSFITKEFLRKSNEPLIIKKDKNVEFYTKVKKKKIPMRVIVQLQRYAKIWMKRRKRLGIFFKLIKPYIAPLRYIFLKWKIQMKKAFLNSLKLPLRFRVMEPESVTQFEIVPPIKITPTVAKPNPNDLKNLAFNMMNNRNFVLRNETMTLANYDDKKYSNSNLKNSSFNII